MAHLDYFDGSLLPIMMNIWDFPQMDINGCIQNGLFVGKYHLEMDCLGVPLFQETTILDYGFSLFYLLRYGPITDQLLRRQVSNRITATIIQIHV